jgi:hypothetical protein
MMREYGSLSKSSLKEKRNINVSAKTRMEFYGVKAA